jgi:hypothetical protein
MLLLVKPVQANTRKVEKIRGNRQFALEYIINPCGNILDICYTFTFFSKATSRLRFMF